MPIYEYRCHGCSESFEVLTSFGNRERTQICPHCESTRTKVLVSAFAAFGGSEAGEAPVSLGGGGCGPGCCGGSCSAN